MCVETPPQAPSNLIIYLGAVIITIAFVILVTSLISCSKQGIEGRENVANGKVHIELNDDLVMERK